jgi:hypothetical protein
MLRLQKPENEMRPSVYVTCNWFPVACNPSTWEFFWLTPCDPDPVCGRCQKTGRVDQCTYDPRLLDDLPVNGDGYPDPPSFVQRDSASGGAGASDHMTWKLRGKRVRRTNDETELIIYA